MKNHPEKLVIFLIGPTAAGKTELALRLARKLPLEIISADSMQVYRGMNIGTASPSRAEMRKVPHHLVNIIDPSEEFDVAEFRKKALAALEAIHGRGKIPLVVGGSGLYLKVLREGIFSGSTRDALLRKRLEKLTAKKGGEWLYQRLKEVDPPSAKKIHPHNLRRIIRALEVYEKSGIPISRWQKKKEGLADKYRVKVFGITRTKPELYERIEARVKCMFKRGLVAEVKRLKQRSPLDISARQAVGYREILDYLSGKIAREAAQSQIIRNTRRLVKRQMTWFRRDKTIKWFKLKENSSLDKVVTEIIQWKKRSSS